jgi:hypothetical protein
MASQTFKCRAMARLPELAKADYAKPNLRYFIDRHGYRLNSSIL